MFKFFHEVFFKTTMQKSIFLTLWVLLCTFSTTKAVTYAWDGTNDPTLVSSWIGTPALTNFNNTVDIFEFNNDATIGGTWTVAGTVIISSSVTVYVTAPFTVKTLKNDGTLTFTFGSLTFSGGGQYSSNGAGTGLIDATNLGNNIFIAGNTSFDLNLSLDSRIFVTVNSGATLTLNSNLLLNTLENNGTIALNNKELGFQQSAGLYSGTGDFTADNGIATPVDKINVNAGGALTVNTGIDVPDGATFEVKNDGILSFATGSGITGAGSFLLSSNGTLYLNDPFGVGNGVMNGQIQTASRNFGTEGNFVFVGADGQSTGAGFPASVRSFDSQVVGMLLLTNSLNITTSFAQTNGTLNTNTKTITFENGVASMTNITLTGGGFLAQFDKIVINTAAANNTTLAFSPDGTNNRLGLLELNIGVGNTLNMGSNITFISDTESEQIQLITGKLNLNGKNIYLTNGAVLKERFIDDGNANNDAIVFDATATDQTNKGGYIQIGDGTNLNRIINATTDVFQGMGLTITSAGSTTVDQVRRYHYNVKHGANGGGVAYGVKRIFEIVGTVPGAPSGTTLEIQYADSDLSTPAGNINETNNIHISRWTSGAGWESYKDGATVSGSLTTFASATNTISITNIPGFSHWTMSGNAQAPLPISLRTFEVKAVGKDIAQLEWTTSSEMNNKGFEIERSTNGRDFTKVGFAEGRGNSQTLVAYTYQDRHIESAYYRLKQVDFDGTFTYSPLAYYSAEGTIHFYPNPVVDRLSLSLPATAELSTKVYSAQGKLLIEARGQAREVENQLTAYFAKAQNGNYTLQTLYNGKSIVQRLIK